MANRFPRVASVDVFRAITMFFMLWVNDFAGMEGIPHFMKHADAAEDMLGFSDLVFPAFLFCVGLSIPFAIENRIQKSGYLRTVYHILVRSLSLIFLGVVSMNLGSMEGGLSHKWLLLIMCVGTFLTWNVRLPSKWLRWAGFALLAGLLFYRWSMGLELRTAWWGILGLIGWAYLFCSLLYLLVRKSAFLHTLAFGAVVTLMLLAHSGVIPSLIVSDGFTHAALVYAGAFCFMHRGAKSFPAVSLGLGVLFAAAGLLSHHFWMISKVQATPTWMFFCTAIFFPLAGILNLVCDRKKFTAWARPIQAAGSSTLTCYFLAYLWYSAVMIFGISFGPMLSYGVPGLCRSFAVALAIILVTELLGKAGIKLKL